MSGNDASRLVVDRKLCQLSGFCVEAAPGLVGFSDEDQLEVLVDRLDHNADALDAAIGAAAVCPFHALSVVHD